MNVPDLDELGTASAYYNYLGKLEASARAAGDVQFAKRVAEHRKEAHAWLAYWAERLDENGRPR